MTAFGIIEDAHQSVWILSLSVKIPLVPSAFPQRILNPSIVFIAFSLNCVSLSGNAGMPVWKDSILYDSNHVPL